MHHLVHIFITK